MDTRTMKTSDLMKRFGPYYKKYTGVLLLDLFCASLTTVCEMVLPLIFRYITNQGMEDMAAITVETIVHIALIYFALRIVDGIASF